MRLKAELLALNVSATVTKDDLVETITQLINQAEYRIAEIDDSRPWGAFFKLQNDNADAFINEFFPGLDPVEARMGNAAAELSPKILLVSPGQRLSWQYHDRRAERWAFLNQGGYHKSMTDDQGEIVDAARGDVVQFARAERHRLVGAPDGYTLVAEIWQHTDPNRLSEEDDIVRLDDDYKR